MNQANPHQQLISNIGDLFLDFQTKIQSYERILLKEKGITDVTANEVRILYMIGLSNNKSMKEIANQLRITQGTLSIAVNTLVKKGYVIRTRHKMDKRVIILYLTRKSIQAIKAYTELYSELIIQLLNVFQEEKIKILERILEELNHILERELEERDEEHE
ncbi:MAG TPA: MarR family transcriptional regulator [Haloplasmataceae bacterium]